MKRSIISQFDQYKERLGGYVGMMSFRYMNLCVKAEEASLIPVEVPIEDELKKIEEAANIAKNDDYSFKVFPIYEDDLLAVGKGIGFVHPEFKQEVETMNIELDDGQKVDVRYILLTMPEVDDERYDVLKTAVDTLYDQCKVQMEGARAEAEAKLAYMMVDETKEDVDRMKDAVDDIWNTWTKKRDQVHEDKLKEIEEGHQRYLQGKAEQQKLLQEQKESNDDTLMHSIRLTQEE